jgi:hypothetical protein
VFALKLLSALAVFCRNILFARLKLKMSIIPVKTYAAVRIPVERIEQTPSHAGDKKTRVMVPRNIIGEWSA